MPDIIPPPPGPFEVLRQLFSKNPVLFALCSMLVIFLFLSLQPSDNVKKHHINPSLEVITRDNSNTGREDCKNTETLFALNELREKVEKITYPNGNEISQYSDEWDNVYSESVVRPLNAAIKTHCEIVKKNNVLNEYTQDNAKDLFRNYIIELNAIAPTVELESSNVLKIHIKGVTFRYEKENYIVSVDMKEVLATYIEKGIIEQLRMTYPSDLNQYLISILEQQSIDELAREALDNVLTQPKLIQVN